MIFAFLALEQSFLLISKRLYVLVSQTNRVQHDLKLFFGLFGQLLPQELQWLGFEVCEASNSFMHLEIVTVASRLSLEMA